ncbi:hypothetical protein [Carboxylicivirga sp. RSCT41]|uniref:hypothetical protein n=1 Tax=Carboxylicivirga agarovorans TaxID=3417570 RepID=UPI003D33C4E5
MRKMGLNLILAVFMLMIVIGIVIIAMNDFDSDPMMAGMSLLMVLSSFSMVLLYLFRRKHERKVMSIIIQLNAEEEIVVEGYADSTDKVNGIGKLCLTNQRLIFSSNKTGEQQFYHLNRIVQVSLQKKFGLCHNGLMINLNGSIKKFEVAYPDDWLKLILAQKQVIRHE